MAHRAGQATTGVTGAPRLPAKSAAAQESQATKVRAEPGVAVATAQSRPKRDYVEAIWTLFCSLRFAVVLNVALALAAMLGTLIPQMPAGIRNFQGEVSRFLDNAHSRFGDLSGVLYWA